MARTLAALLAALLLAACAPHLAPLHNDSAERQAASATVVVADGHALCAGVALRPRLFVTARHCVSGTRESYRDHADVDSGEGSRPAYLLARGSSDLALLATSETLPWTVAIGDDPVDGEEVFSVGHPDGSPYHLRRGVVTDAAVRVRVDTGPTLELVATTIRLQPGFSGGGLFNSRGELVGVAESTGNGRGYFTPASQLRAMLR